MDIEDILFHIFDILKEKNKVKRILALSLVNRKTYEIGTNYRYNIPEIKFIRTVADKSSRDLFMNSIICLYQDLNISDILTRHICKTDVDLVVIILEKKFGINPLIPIIDSYEIIRKIINIIDEWCSLWLGIVPSETSTYEIIGKIFLRMYKHLIKTHIFRTSTVRDKFRFGESSEPKFKLCTDQLLIKSSTYNFSPNLSPHYTAYFYAVDILCYIKIIYHSILLYDNLSNL